jgi:biotin-[acetyl-CoA-carboxylase] ligase BirA-like protein
MIKQIHLIDCDSTQDVLKEQLNSHAASEQILVSCENQVAGRGRGENKWKAMPGTLCFSINIAPHPVMSFTAIELSVIIADFFENKNQKIQLKWPNDLWDKDGKKCGGILVQGSQNFLMAGIGINLFSDDDQFGGVFENAFGLDKKRLAQEIAEYIHANRIPDAKQLSSRWLVKCGHLNQMVKIIEGSDVTEGIFQGLGDFGEALICRDSKTIKIYNGSLRLS